MRTGALLRAHSGRSKTPVACNPASSCCLVRVVQHKRARQSFRGVRARASNPVGVHALVFSGDWGPESCKTAVSGAKQAGYDLIEVPLLDPASVDTEMTRGVLSEYDMRASASLGLSPDADINSEDNDMVAKGEELLDLALNAVADMKGEYLVGVLYSALKKYPGPCSAAARKNVVAALKRLATKAEDKGVTIGLEVVNRYETNVINTATQAMELLADVGNDALMVHLDTYHMNIEEMSMAAAVRACRGRLGYVHIGESHRGYLGTGSVDYKGLFEALEHAEFSGPITFESFSSAVVSKDLSNTLCVWRNLWQDGPHLAAHAREFIRNQQTSAAQGLAVM